MPAFSSSLDVSGSLSDSACSLSVSEFTSSCWSESSGSLPKAFENGGRGNIQNMKKMFGALKLW